MKLTPASLNLSFASMRYLHSTQVSDQILFSTGHTSASVPSKAKVQKIIKNLIKEHIFLHSFSCACQKINSNQRQPASKVKFLANIPEK